MSLDKLRHTLIATITTLCVFIETKLLNARNGHDLQKTFKITHPFHPCCGSEFEVEFYNCGQHEDWILSRDKNGQKITFPASWTSLLPPDPFVVMSAGRSLFRLQDLIKLADYVKHLKGLEEHRGKSNQDNV